MDHANQANSRPWKRSSETLQTLGVFRRYAALGKTNIAMENGPGLKMYFQYFLLNMWGYSYSVAILDILVCWRAPNFAAISDRLPLHKIFGLLMIFFEHVPAFSATLS